jgi:LmbE family N-acetylglucosaminyl deacetylase
LLVRTHRITHRLPVQLVAVKPARVLVLAPHMDDEVIPIGGTLALHRQVGSTVGVIYVSDSAGDPEQTKKASETAVRKEEARACSQFLGFEILKFLDLPDGSLTQHEPAIASEVARILADWKPDLIFAPFPTDHHRDHQATTAGLCRAIQQSGWSGEVWGYEVWSTLWPNRCVDITAQVETKRQSILCHASQCANMSYVEAALGLNRYRGLKVGVAYAEAFYAAEAREFVKLCNELLERI